MTALPIHRRQKWIVIGDQRATATKLVSAISAGQLDAADRVAAIWIIREIEEQYGDNTDLADALSRLDPDGTTPPRLSYDQMRLWLTHVKRNEPRGTLNRIAAATGIRASHLSVFRNRGPLGAARAERLGAVIVAIGRGELPLEREAS